VLGEHGGRVDDDFERLAVVGLVAILDGHVGWSLS
jgi:hypothetical protein